MGELYRLIDRLSHLLSEEVLPDELGLLELRVVVRGGGLEVVGDVEGGRLELDVLSEVLFIVEVGKEMASLL